MRRCPISNGINSMKPLVSVIIPTKNEERNIARCLESVRRQDYPGDKIEIIVVDNFSTDKTKEIAREFAGSVFEKGPERSAQRNLGIEKAKGRYFIFLDADMALSQNVISECVSRMENDSGLVGLYIPEKMIGDGFWPKVRNFERSFYDETPIDGLRFIRTQAARSIGGFDEKLYAAEDWDFDKRLKPMGKTGIIKSPLYHNEEQFALRNYLRKKSYYTDNFGVYIRKWGNDDPDIKKQFGMYYRFIRVFAERGKWKKIVRHPVLALGMYILRFLVGVNYLLKRNG